MSLKPTIQLTARLFPGNKKSDLAGFTLVEAMISAAIFVVAFAGFFLAYGQAIRMLDGLRQVSRAEDIALANIEFLRTRSWEQLTNMYVTTSATTPIQSSSNMIESINLVVTSVSNSPVCTHLEVITGDPLRIGLKNVKRDLIFFPNPVTAPITTPTVITGTVIVTWDSMEGKRFTNSMTTVLTKGGMTADVAY